MNTLKKLALTGAATALTLENTFAASSTNGSTLFGSTKVDAAKTGTTEGLDVAVQTLINSFLAILGVVAVAYGIYGGVLMVTAGGDEEKVKKGRTILIQVAIGLVVIFLANAVVRWVLGAIV